MSVWLYYGSGLPEQLLLLVLESKDVLLVLIQRLQISCLLGDFAIFVFFDHIVVLVDFDFLGVAFRRLLSPSVHCSIVRLRLWRRWFRSCCCIISHDCFRYRHNCCSHGWSNFIRLLLL